MPRPTQPLLLPLALVAGLASAGDATAQDSVAAGASCPQLDFGVEPPTLAVNPEEIQLSADEVDLSEEGLSKLLGAVELRQGDRVIRAEALDYDEQAQEVQIGAESVFRSRSLSVRSQAARVDLDDQTGEFRGTEFVVPAHGAHGSAQTLRIRGEGQAELETVRYSTCAPGTRGWSLKASAIALDQKEGLGTARNARINFLGVPILYAPWFRFPIDDRRRTGLLYPTVGDSDRTGFDLRVPLYVNLAPNYDATFTPRYMAERGTQFNTDFRYLLARGEGKARYEYLGRDEKVEEKRSYFDYEHHGLINRRTGLEVLYGATSDQRYFEDLGGGMDLSSLTHLERSARITYQAPAAYSIQALVQNFQALNPNLTARDEPYRRLPQILFHTETVNSLFATRAGLDGEYVNFARDASVEGQRLDLHPYLRWEREASAWYARGDLEFNYTRYDLRNAAPGAEPQPDRSLPRYSAETGLRFERFTGNGQLQLLEPKAFYLYTPYRSQDALPNFDSGEPDFEFTQLFAPNRFLGRDRISDANHIALATSLRQLDPETGINRFTASIGQLFRLDDPRVTLPGGEAPDAGATDFIASLDYRLSPRWRGVAASQWSPETSEFNRSSFALRYRRERRRLDLAYRYRKDVLEQSDVMLYTPLGSSWGFAGRWRYSLQETQSMDAMAGLEYSTCCWSLRTSYRRHIATTAGEYSNGVYLQLELKGLARLGSGFDDLLGRREEP